MQNLIITWRPWAALYKLTIAAIGWYGWVLLIGLATIDLTWEE